MTLSLHDAVIPTYIQMLNAALGLIDKAQGHCTEKGISEQALLAAKLADDMLPLSWQLKWLSTHSIGAIEGVRQGSFSPDRSLPADNFAALRHQISDAIAALETVTADEMESFAGREVIFTAGEMRLPFQAQDFLLSFSLPNFHFHATTAYDILRQQGLPIGKRDYLGAMRIARAA